MINAIQMPKACISCKHYEHVGFDQDEHCPFKSNLPKSRPTSGKTQYGQCIAHGEEVFATQICNGYMQDEGVEVVEVTNRPEPRVIFQEPLMLVSGAI